MHLRSLATGFLTAAVMAATAVPTARAADLDDPYASYGMLPPPIAETKVEFGTGWYVRGDIAAKNDENVVTASRYSADTEAFGVLQQHRLGYDLSLGGGYSFTNGLRADVVADFHQPTSISQYDQRCITTATLACSVYGKFDSYDALVNAYYDFGTWHRVTPYVGAGVGVAFGQSSAQLSGDPSGTYYAKYGYHNLAFALMAGIAVDVYDHVKVDVGYRYLNNGKVAGTNIDFQEARIGVRYMIDK